MSRTRCLAVAATAAATWLATVSLATMSPALLRAQQPASPPAPPATPRAAALVDLTGNWVSLVTEEWRWRMTTPPRGDYISLPLSDEGRRVADTWTPALDGSCKAYGAGGVMWLPTRLRVWWEGDQALKVETDAGQQTRLLGFDAARPAGPRSLQGFSVAAWEPMGGAPVLRIASMPLGYLVDYGNVQDGNWPGGFDTGFAVGIDAVGGWFRSCL